MGSKPVEDVMFPREIKIRSTTSFGGEVKLSEQCVKILRHVKNPAEYKRDSSSAKLTAISCQVSSASLPVDSSGYCQRALWIN
jgi:hypothetical protein